MTVNAPKTDVIWCPPPGRADSLDELSGGVLAMC